MNAVRQGDAVLESYGYNHRGERVLRTRAGGVAQITLYDEAGRWLGSYSATGLAEQQAIWLDNYLVALINVPGTGVPELTYVQPDHLGTPRVVIDPMRNVAIWEWSNKSEVFGNQIPSADPDGDGVAFELALRFPGQQDGSRYLVLPGLIKGNPINQTVDPCGRTIKNVALPGHQFGGSVTISIQQRSGVVGAHIVGAVIGPNPIMNQLMGSMIFEYLGSRAARSLGP